MSEMGLDLSTCFNQSIGLSNSSGLDPTGLLLLWELKIKEINSQILAFVGPILPPGLLLQGPLLETTVSIVLLTMKVPIKLQKCVVSKVL